MKKTLLMILCLMALLIACVVLAGCGGSSDGGEISPDSPYIGTWQAQEQDINEVLEGDYTFTLNEDGSAKHIYADEEQDAVWYETKSGIHIKGDDVDMDLDSAEDALTVKILGVTIFFEKQ